MEVSSEIVALQLHLYLKCLSTQSAFGKTEFVHCTLLAKYLVYVILLAQIQQLAQHLIVRIQFCKSPEFISSLSFLPNKN